MRGKKLEASGRPDNPWGEESVIWRDILDCADFDNPYAEFHKLLADPHRTHIVREVQVRTSFLPTSAPKTQSEAEDVVAIGNNEFDRLREKGIEVARADWHIVGVGEFIGTILARVPIVDGRHRSTSAGLDDHIHPAELSCLDAGIDAYVYDHALNDPYLSDIDGSWQYVYGCYRSQSPQTAGATPFVSRAILVDPDLILSHAQI